MDPASLPYRFDGVKLNWTCGRPPSIGLVPRSTEPRERWDKSLCIRSFEAARWSEGVYDHVQDSYSRGSTDFRDVRFTGMFLSVKSGPAGRLGADGM